MARNKFNAGDTVEIIDDVDSYGRFRKGQRGVVEAVTERWSKYAGVRYCHYEYDISGISGPVRERRLEAVDVVRVIERREDATPWDRYED